MGQKSFLAKMYLSHSNAKPFDLYCNISNTPKRENGHMKSISIGFSSFLEHPSNGQTFRNWPRIKSRGGGKRRVMLCRYKNIPLHKYAVLGESHKVYGHNCSNFAFLRTSILEWIPCKMFSLIFNWSTTLKKFLSIQK